MVIKNHFINTYYFKRALKSILILGLLVFIIQPAWAQNDEENSYPDLKPAGFIQGYFSASDLAEVPSSFSMKRARLGFKGSISKNIQLNFIGGTVEPPNNAPALVNAFADFTLDPLFNIRAGQFIVPFGLEGPEPIIKNPAIQRAFSTRNMNTFRMFRDIGVMAYGEHSYVNYSVAVVNGSGANVIENLYQKDVLGRFDFTLAGGLMAGVSGHIGTFGNTNEQLSQQRWGAHAEYKNAPLQLRGELIFHNRETPANSWDQSRGGYFLGKYEIGDKWEAIGRWDYHEPDTPDNIYQGLTLGTNYQLSGLSSLSLNGTAYTEDDANTLHYRMNVQLQLVL